MINELRIENFRGLKEIKLTELSTINLIVGTNNSGKTSVLEAIDVLLCSKSEFDNQTRDGSVFRGIGNIDLPFTHLSEPNRQPSIFASFGYIDCTRQLLYTHKRSQLTVVDPSTKMGSAVITNPNDLRKSTEFVNKVENLGMVLSISTNLDSNHSLLQNYSALAISDSENELFEILKKFEPRFERIDTLSNADGILTMYIRIKGAGKVPIWLMGQGFIRLISIYTRIIAAKKKYILIDEIEQGMHYSNMSVLWSALALISKELDLQIFATTHSSDAIQSAASLSPEQQKLFKLVRLENQANHAVGRSFDLSNVSSALDSGFEVR